MIRPLFALGKWWENLGSPRSGQWPRVRREWLATHPKCAACGGTENVEVHHKRPFHLAPALELDPLNFITLCEKSGKEHHLHVGHLGNWQNFNPNVESDAAAMLRTSPIAKPTLMLGIRRAVGLIPTVFTPFPGVVTSYGYPGDSTPDTNSEHAIGAWNNTLIPYKSLAISPDVETAFRDAGIDPLDPVEVQCANGDILSLSWGDKTASDAKARQLGLAPLRGRFDIFSPRGKAAHDGQRVIGFRKA